MAETPDNLIIRVGSFFEASASRMTAIIALLLIVLAMLAYGWISGRT